MNKGYKNIVFIKFVYRLSQTKKISNYKIKLQNCNIIIWNTILSNDFQNYFPVKYDYIASLQEVIEMLTLKKILKVTIYIIILILDTKSAVLMDESLKEVVTL